MLSKLKNEHYGSLKDIDVAISKAQAELVEARKHMRDLYLERSACIHLYKKPSFTIQSRLIGCVRVNKRFCAHCGHTETQSENDNGNDRPEWAKEATEAYYNNNI